MQQINFPKPRLHFFVCVNDRTGTGSTTPSCGPRINADDIKVIKQWIREQGWTGIVQCTKAACLGFCNKESSVACVYPEGKFVKGILSAEEIKTFILEETEKLGI